MGNDASLNTLCSCLPSPAEALEAIHRAQDGISINLPGDLISEDLRECLLHLSEIIGGAFDAEDVIGNIFRIFCIGK